MLTTVKINGREIGTGRTYIIAEAGSNHNHDFNTAKELIQAAAEAGADAVKFQAFRAREHYSIHTPGFSYLENKGHRESTYKLIESLEFNRDWHVPLMEYAEKCGITFLSSPCDAEAVHELGRLNMEAFKLASFDLPDIDLIKTMARYGKPLILSTGMANYSDIEAAIKASEEAGNNNIILLQCTSLYPAPARLANLAAISTMKAAFGYPVGYSDHSIGEHISIAAVAMGASVVEKHFTLDRDQPGPDHNFAIEPGELAKMIERIRDVEESIGSGIKNGPHPEETEMYEKGRRSLHCRKAVKAGEVITREKLIIKRPGLGISPRHIDHISGLVAKRDIPEDHWITWEDFK